MKLIAILTWLYAPAFGVIAIVLFLSEVTGRLPGDFTRDPSTVMQFNPSIGLLSNLGILLWCATASCCFFAATVLKPKNREIALFLFFSGLLTTVLLFDDFFLFHEKIAVKLFQVEETIIYPIYGILTFIYLFRFRDLFLKTEVILFILAILLFATSMILDLFFVATPQSFWHYLFEDGVKFFGIITWFSYFVRCSLQAVISNHLPLASS